MSFKDKYKNRLAFADDDTKAELLSIKEDEKEIEDRFYKDLAFGTGVCAVLWAQAQTV